MASGAAWLAQRVGWGVVGREYLLAGHLIDRAGMPGVIGDYGKEVMTDVAIEEWRGASPVYTLRTRQLLGITTDDVEAIFKTMQFDIGAPHGFLDFRFEVLEPDHGEFSLAHCGALVDVEPMGVEFVEAMCHTIEDPTFDATAAATKSKSRRDCCSFFMLNTRVSYFELLFLEKVVVKVEFKFYAKKFSK